MEIAPFEPRRFRTAAAYYSRYRVPYPPELIETVARRVVLRPGDRVLDLGCGPGMLAIGFARLGASVVAIDPEPEMLEEARHAIGLAGVDVELRQGSSYDLGPDLAGLRLVAMGRSFHWMDRVKTLATLDQLIVPGGGIALLHDRGLVATPDWRQAMHDVVEFYAPGVLSRAVHRQPNWHRHEEVLIDSPFSVIETTGRIFRRDLSIDDIIGRTFSLSTTAPEVFGDKAEAFEAALRGQLEGLAPDGRFTELVEVAAMLAFRP